MAEVVYIHIKLERVFGSATIRKFVWAVDEKQDIFLLWPNSLHTYFYDMQTLHLFTILMVLFFIA